jgi:hypothetical protein
MSGVKPPPVAEQKPGELPVIYLMYRKQKREQSLKVVSGAEYVFGRAGDADVVVDDQ